MASPQPLLPKDGNEELPQAIEAFGSQWHAAQLPHDGLRTVDIGEVSRRRYRGRDSPSRRRHSVSETIRRDVAAIANLSLVQPKLVQKAGSLLGTLGRRVSRVQVQEVLQRVEEQEAASGLSALEVGYSVANMIIGGAILTVPYSFTLCGWAGVAYVITGSAAMLFTGLLLGHVLTEVRDRGHNAPDLGVVSALTFGPACGPVLAAFCLGEIFFTCIFFMVFTSHCLGEVLGTAPGLLIWGVAAAALAVSLVPRRYVALLDVLGLLLTLCASLVVMLAGLLLPPDRGDAGQTLLGREPLLGLAACLSAVAVCVGDHPLFPGVHARARSPGSYQRGLAGAFAVFALVGVSLPAVAYATFGTSLRPLALANVGLDARGARNPAFPGWVAGACSLALALRNLVILPVWMRPLTSLLECLARRLMGADPASDSGTDSGLLTRRGSRFALMACSFLAVALCGVALADLLPELETLLSSLFKSVNDLIIPCWSYRTLCSEQLRGRPVQAAAVHLLLLVGAAWGVLGTATALGSILGGTHG